MTEVKRIPTGIVELDSLMRGGYLPGRSYIVTGDAGTGKTTACIQFLMRGLEGGEKAVYVTVDERPHEILQAAASLGWDLHHYVQAKSLIVLDALPYFSGRAGTAAAKGVDLQKIISDLSGYVKRLEASRLVIDPVTPLILNDDSHVRVQEHARLLLHLLQTNLTTTNLLTAQSSPRVDREPGGGIAEFLAAGVLVLKVTPLASRVVRTLCVKKMRGTAVEPNEYQFTIAENKGIVLVSPDLQAVEEPQAQPKLEFFELSDKDG